ncbi:phage tail sheath family protein [Mycetohabitans rhizoxinica]|uniref:Phage tail sheath family protein n=2 Tax=Mycetohabitans rhizoxinica TaxID=412963 RepID=A0ABZ2PVQ7_9BURK
MDNECKEGIMVDYKVPGVYVEEPFELALSIPAGETAIPVFACDDVKQSKVSDLQDGQEIQSWLDVNQLIAKQRDPLQQAVANATTTDSLKTAQEALNNFNDALLSDPLYLSLKTYFDNGGGRAYVMNVNSLASAVPGFDDITLLVQAGAKLDSFKTSVSTLCKPGNTYFAVFDGPSEEIDRNGQVTASTASIGSDQETQKKAKNATEPKDATDPTKDYDSNPYTAAYYPWLQADWAIKSDKTRVDIPPSAAVAGAYCTVDRERGVWKAPANVALKGGVTPKYKVSDDLNGILNMPVSGGKAINVIRAFRGTGPLIWGARTLKSDLDTWRYVPVRRLFNAVEKDVHRAMGVAVFEPNSAPTWERVRSAIDIYLHSLWRQGALQGSTPQQAYFVQVGLGQTMTADDINNGKLIVQIGLAAVRPAEFIILQVSQQQLSVS